MSAAARRAVPILAAYTLFSTCFAYRSYVETERGPVHYLATHALLANHRVAERDLTMPPAIRGTRRAWQLPSRASMTGKYVASAVRAHQPVVADDLLDEPRIEERADSVIVSIPVPAELPADAVDAGSLVDLVSGGRTVATRRRVAAVRCTTATSCVALIQLPPAVAATLGDKPTLFVRTDRGGVVMEKKEWAGIGKFEVESNPAGVWTRVLEYVPANTVLRVESTGTWQYSDNPVVRCGPDGDPSSTLAPPHAIAPVGAVIGRIGGSTATISAATDTSVFAVGSFAIVSAQTAGPLYLTINVPPAKFPKASEKIAVTVSEFKP